jgi:hypothetical protein
VVVLLGQIRVGVVIEGRAHRLVVAH